MKLKRIARRKFNVLHPPVYKVRSGVGFMEIGIGKINRKTCHTCTDRDVNNLTIMCGST
jgi:hypothetical protein